MMMHPSGQSLVLGLTMGGILHVDITTTTTKPSSTDDNIDDTTNYDTLHHSIPKLTLVKDKSPWNSDIPTKVGVVKSLDFSSDGKLLAIGGEDGTVQLLRWPSLAIHAKWTVGEKAIRNIDFSKAHSDGILVTVDESGACQLWETRAGGGTEVARLSPPVDMPRAGIFRCLSVVDEEGISFYGAARWKGEGWVLQWRQDEEGELKYVGKSHRPVAPAPLCGFNASHDGTLLAGVTPEGDVCAISTQTLRPVKYRKAAHLTFSTAVAFSPDDTAILSTSGDASAVLTVLRKKNMAGGDGGIGGGGLVRMLLFILAILVLVLAVLWQKLVEQYGGEVGIVEILKELLMGEPVKKL
jgi:prolactin regulatory element-binding protein